MWIWVPCLLAVLGAAALFLPHTKYFTRIVLYYSCLLLSTFVCLPFQYPYKPDPNNSRVVAWLLKKLCSWMDLRVEYRGFEHVNFDGPAVLVLNHQSALDILGTLRLGVTFMGPDLPPGMVPIVKKELFYMGPFGLSCYFNGAIAVNRSDPKQSHASVNSSVQSAITNHLKVMIFAEGTRYHAGQGMLPFKKGGFHLAVQGQIPIIPVVISSYRNFYSKPRRKFEIGGEVIVQILPPTSTKGCTTEDVTPLTEKIRNDMLPVLEAISQEAEERFNKKSL